MESWGWHATILVVLLISSFATSVSAVEPLAIDAPDVVGYWEMFDVSLKIDDDYIQKNARIIDINIGGGTGGNPITAWTNLPLDQYNYIEKYQYNGEKVIPFKLQYFPSGLKGNETKVREISFLFYNDKNGLVAKATRNITVVPVKASFSLPQSGFTWDQFKEPDPFHHTLAGEYKKQVNGIYWNSERITFEIRTESLAMANKFGQGSLEARADQGYLSGVEGSTKIISGDIVKKYGGVTGYYRIWQSIQPGNWDSANKKRFELSSVTYSAVIFTNSTTFMVYWNSNDEDSSGTHLTHEEDMKKNAEAFLSSFTLTQKINPSVTHQTIVDISGRPKTITTAANPQPTTTTTLPPSGGDCSNDKDCPKGEKCNACHECVSTPLIPRSEAKLDWKVEASLDKSSVKNSIQSKVLLTAVATPVVTDKSGKKISLCDVRAPGPAGGAAIQARMANEKPYAGFVEGLITDPRETLSTPTPLTVKEEGMKVQWVIRPDDRKKIVGKVFDVSESIVVVVNDGNKESVSREMTLTLTEAGPSVEYSMPHMEAQQGTSRAIKVTVKDDDSPKVWVKAVATGFGHISYPDRPKSPYKQILVEQKTGDRIDFAYHAPKLGNFNIGKAISSLSMWDLQKEGAKATLRDSLAIGVGHGAGKLIDQADDSYRLAQAGQRTYMAAGKSAKQTVDLAKNTAAASKYAENARKFAYGLKAGKGVYDVNSVGQTQYEEHQKSQDSSERQEKTSSEQAAEYGITAINIVQMSVTALTFIPNHIPGVGHLTSAVQVGIVGSTNIVKADLQYWANSEKINRAKELFLPDQVLVIVEDESGWQHVSIVEMKVAFHEI